MPKVDYEERQEEKLESYQRLSKKHIQEANQRDNQAKKLGEALNGQPILVGHHSEKRTRKAYEKIHSDIDKAFEHRKTAEYYDNKVSNIESPHAISSDDPEAIQKLKEKLAKVLQEIQYWKGIKKCVPRTYDGTIEDARWYMLDNRNAEKRRILKRIETLKKLDKVQAQEFKNNDITLEVNKDQNRIMIYFPGKPDEEIRTKLKRHGFRWSPRNTAWQSYINQWNLDFAKEEVLKL